MGCGCGGGGVKAAMAAVQTYQIEGDPEGIKYLTERDAITQKDARGLEGDVVPTVK